MTALELVGRTTVAPEPVARPTFHVPRGNVLTTLQPLVYGYVRVGPTDPPESDERLTCALRLHAKHEGLTLAHVFTDHYQDGSEQFERNRFSALVDALKRPGGYGVFIPSLGHFSRFPGMCQAMCTLIQLETGVRVLVMNNSGEEPRQ